MNIDIYVIWSICIQVDGNAAQLSASLDLTREKQWRSRQKTLHKHGALVAEKLAQVICSTLEKEFFIDNLLVRIHLIIAMIWRYGVPGGRAFFNEPGTPVCAMLS